MGAPSLVVGVATPWTEEAVSFIGGAGSITYLPTRGGLAKRRGRMLVECKRMIPMEPTIQCGKHLAEHADISGSQFHAVNLSGADFNDVNLSRARFHNINLSDIQVSAVQIGGATFKHVGPPPDKDGRQARQRPVVFEEAMLGDSTFRQVDMSNVKIIDCNIQGMTIDGVLVTDLLKEHKRKNR